MENSFPENTGPLISELVALLEPDYVWQAGVLIRLREVVESNSLTEAERQFSAGDIWGGSGSVSDVSFPDSSSNYRKCGLMIGLVEAFASAGITNNAATEMAAIYRSWLEQGVFKRSTT